MREPDEIRDEIERLIERRRELLRKLAQTHDVGAVAERHDIEQQIADLWEEHRIARAHARFGERELIIRRARHEERLERAA
jgi:hypothetical protein